MQQQYSVGLFVPWPTYRSTYTGPDNEEAKGCSQCLKTKSLSIDL